MLTNIFSIILSVPLLSGEAYLDPGSGSYLLQILLATLLGGTFLLRSFWGRILHFFRKDSTAQNDAAAAEEQPDQAETAVVESAVAAENAAAPAKHQD